MRFSKKSIVVSTATFVLVGGVSAFAWVNATGGGSGSATAAGSDSVKPVTLTPTISETLEPGANIAIHLDAENPNNYKVALHTIDVVKDTKPDTWPATCNYDDFSVAPASVPAPGGIVVNAGVSTLAGSAYTQAKISMAEDTDTSCLGLTVPLKVTAS